MLTLNSDLSLLSHSSHTVKALSGTSLARKTNNRSTEIVCKLSFSLLSFKPANFELNSSVEYSHSSFSVLHVCFEKFALSLYVTGCTEGALYPRAMHFPKHRHSKQHKTCSVLFQKKNSERAQ